MKGVMMNRRKNNILGRTLAVSLASAMVLALPASAFAMPKPQNQKITQDDFNNAMRKLWEDHITWTRLFIVSAEANLPDKAATTARLLQNQTDIGNAMAGFYGDAAGAQLTALLKDHILGAAALIAAAQSGDQAAIADASAKWYANADEIATFLSNANPVNWPLAEMKADMKMHLDLTLQEAVDHLQGNFAADVQDYDKVHAHILGLADLLSSGIEKQFPQKFIKN
jgi:hypothetical protein